VAAASRGLIKFRPRIRRTPCKRFFLLFRSGIPTGRPAGRRDTPPRAGRFTKRSSSARTHIYSVLVRSLSYNPSASSAGYVTTHTHTRRRPGRDRRKTPWLRTRQVLAASSPVRPSTITVNDPDDSYT